MTPGRWALVWAWWCAWRFPWWRAWIDFYDSVQFHDRVVAGPAAGFQWVNAHLPLQSTVYGPAALLHEWMGARWSPEASITMVSTLYGALAFGAALATWRRYFPPAVVTGAVVLYPVLAGAALADLGTYSMSAVHAFLWGGTALLSRGLDERSPARALGWCLAAALAMGLAVYTHVLAALWATVPAVVVWAFLATGHGTVRARMRRVLWMALVPSLACVVGLLWLEGWQASLVGLAEDAPDGAWKLLFRDAGGERWFQAQLRHVAVLTGGVGLPVLAWGAARWARAEGAWAWIAVGACTLSALACGYQFHWGFQGRLWLPVLLWVVPLTALAVTTRWGRAAFALVMVQGMATFIHVHGTRVAGPHPPQAERDLSASWDAERDVHVVARRAAGFTRMPPKRTVAWEHDEDRAALDLAVADARARGGQVWISSQALRVPYQLRDGHLVAVDNSASPRAPTRLERWLLDRDHALELGSTTGRGEFVARLVDGAGALNHRVADHLSAGWAVLVVQAGEPAFVTVLSDEVKDCVLREAWDAWDLEAWYAVLRTGCRPVLAATTDARGRLVRPLPSRGGYTITQAPLDGTPPLATTISTWVAAPVEGAMGGRTARVAILRPGLEADTASVGVPP